MLRASAAPTSAHFRGTGMAGLCVRTSPVHMGKYTEEKTLIKVMLRGCLAPWSQCDQRQSLCEWAPVCRVTLCLKCTDLIDGPTKGFVYLTLMFIAY